MIRGQETCITRWTKVEKEEKRRAKAKKLKEKEDARHSKEKTKMKEVLHAKCKGKRFNFLFGLSG